MYIVQYFTTDWFTYLNLEDENKPALEFATFDDAMNIATQLKELEIKTRIVHKSGKEYDL